MKLNFNGDTYGGFGKYRYITCNQDMEIKYVKNMETGEIYKFDVMDLLREAIERMEE